MIGDAWQWIPFMFIVLLAALEAQPVDEVEAAMVDGASRWQVFRYLTVPAILPVSVTLILIRMIEAFKIVDLPNVLTNGGPGIASESLTPARLHGLARARPRRLGRDRLHPAVRGHLLLRHLREPRPAARVPRHEAHRHGCAAIDEPTPFWKVVSYVLLGFWTFVVLFPLYWLAITSFKLPIDVNDGPFYLPCVDFQPSLDAWQYLFGTMLGDTLRPYLNTVIVALCSSAIAVAVGTMAAYALVRLTYRPRVGAILCFVAVRDPGDRRGGGTRRAVGRRRGLRPRRLRAAAARLRPPLRDGPWATTTSPSGWSRSASCRRSPWWCRSMSCSSIWACSTPAPRWSSPTSRSTCRSSSG